MGRRYTVPFSATAITVAVDLFEVLAATGKPFILREVVIAQASDYGDAQAEGLSILIKRAASTYTTGSGGSTVTPTHNTNTSAAGPTAKVVNTTQAVVNTGTLVTIRAEAFNVQGGWQFLPTPEQAMEAYLFLPGEACIVSMTVPADSLTVSGTLEFEEL